MYNTAVGQNIEATKQQGSYTIDTIHKYLTNFIERKSFAKFNSGKRKLSAENWGLKKIKTKQFTMHSGDMTKDSARAAG